MGKDKEKKKCSVEGCCNDSRSLGYCNMHYQRFLRIGMIEAVNKNKKWTQEEVDYLKANYTGKVGQIQKVADHLGRSYNSVREKAKTLGIKTCRYLKSEEIDYIMNNPHITNQYLAKRLKISKRSVINYRTRYNAGTYLDSVEDKITVAEITRLTGVSRHTVHETWIKNHGLPAKKIDKYRMVKLNDLLEWMQEHPERWDATRCERWYFSQYPWFEEKRKDDFAKMVKKKWGENAS